MESKEMIKISETFTWDHACCYIVYDNGDVSINFNGPSIEFEKPRIAIVSCDSGEGNYGLLLDDAFVPAIPDEVIVFFCEILGENPERYGC